MPQSGKAPVKDAYTVLRYRVEHRTHEVCIVVVAEINQTALSSAAAEFQTGKQFYLMVVLRSEQFTRQANDRGVDWTGMQLAAGQLLSSLSEQRSVQFFERYNRARLAGFGESGNIEADVSVSKSFEEVLHADNTLIHKEGKPATKKESGVEHREVIVRQGSDKSFDKLRKFQ